MKKLCFLLIFLSGCSPAVYDKLSRIGRPPEFSPLEGKMEPEQKVTMPMPQPIPASYRVNSLWQPGARAFFKDQRAKEVGDILTVIVNIQDNANLSNETTQARASHEVSTLSSLFGVEKLLGGTSPVSNATNVNTNNAPQHDGKGTVVRTETLSITLAAVITQNLPNGNLVIHGKQEIRVNNELREIEVSGIVRREDIMSTNTISYDKIAQARISYGGRGQISDIQSPRWGYQLIEALSPL